MTQRQKDGTELCSRPKFHPEEAAQHRGGGAVLPPALVVVLFLKWRQVLFV